MPRIEPAALSALDGFADRLISPNDGATVYWNRPIDRLLLGDNATLASTPGHLAGCVAEGSRESRVRGT
jgi:hypothetical protein